MSRKRKLKKERLAREDLGSRLLALCGQGDAGEQFLELASGCGAELPAGVGAEVYGEVVDRVLARALAAGDLPRLERLRGRLRAGARSRPLARLAEVVVELAAGRLDGAHAGLAALAREEAGRGVPSRLLPALAALGSPAPAGTEDLDVQAGPAWRLYRWLDGLPSQGFRPGSGEAAELRRILGELAAAVAADPAVRKLVCAAERYAGLIAEVAALDEALEETLRRADAGDDRPVRDLEERLQRFSRPLLEAFRSGPPASLLKPLHHALRLGWRGLLARLLAAGAGGSPHAALGLLSPALLDLDLAAVGGDDWAGGPERLRLARTIGELRQAGRHRELADLLASRGRDERAPERLTLSWSLELWALARAAEEEEPEIGFDDGDGWEEDGEEEDGEGRGPGDRDDREEAEPAGYAAVARIEQMAAALAGALPAERRPEVARFLAARLLELLIEEPLDPRVGRAAASLLQHLPDDAGLLGSGMAVAVATGDVRRQRLLADRIAGRGAARAEDREVLLRLALPISDEDPERAVAILGALRPLATEDVWPEMLSRLAEGMVDDFCMQLFMFLGVAGVLGGAAESPDLSSLRRSLALYRPLLAGRAELAALETVIEILAGGRDETGRLRRFFAEWPGLEPALIVLQALSMAGGPEPRPALRRVLCQARDQVFARLDSRWRFWLPRLPDLLHGASAAEVGHLCRRLQSLLAREELEPEGREVIGHALEKLRMVAPGRRGMGRGRGGRRSPLEDGAEEDSSRPGPRRARRRRRNDGHQLRLEMP